MSEGNLEKYGSYQRSAIGGEGQENSGPSLTNSLPQMMYGYGDSESPLPETVACMEQLVCEYVRHITDEACTAAEVKGRLDTDCFVFAVRGDRPKYKRARELIDLNAHIKSATRQRFTDQDASVFNPSFASAPKVRAVASVRCLSADDPEPPLPSPPPPPGLASSSSSPSSAPSSPDVEGEEGR